MAIPLIFQNVLLELSNHLNQPISQADLNGYFVFKLEDNIVVKLCLSENNTYFYLSSVIIQPPISGKDRRSILSISLEANFFGQGTNGATFAFDRAANELIFFRSFLMNRTKVPVFFNALKDLILHVKEWRKRFQEKNYYGTWRQNYRGMGEGDIQPFWTRV